MRINEFGVKIRELLPDATPSAISAFAHYVALLERDGAQPASTHFDWYYVNISLVLRDYGVEIATKLFNHGENFTFNPFELRGAARLLNEGWDLKLIQKKTLVDGCDATLQEDDESRRMLKAFQEQQLQVQKAGGAATPQLPPPHQQIM